MSSPKFLVFKLKDLRIPALVLLIVVALFVLLLFKNKTTQTFAPSTGYEDGKYIAGITLSNTDMDLVVEVQDNNIISISLLGLEDTSSDLYQDFTSGINYINTYVTATQSLELPQNGDTTTATMILMDAVKVALSTDTNASLSTTYEKVDLSPNQVSSTEEASLQDTASTEELVNSTSTDNIIDSTSTDEMTDSTEALDALSTEDEIFVDEFQEEDFPAFSEDVTLEDALTIE